MTWGQGYRCRECNRSWDRDDDPPEYCLDEPLPKGIRQTTDDPNHIRRVEEEADAAAEAARNAAAISAPLPGGSHIATAINLMEICEKGGLAEFRANCTFKPMPDSDSLFPVEYFWHGEGIHPRLGKVPPYTDADRAGSMTVITRDKIERVLRNRVVVVDPPYLQWYDRNARVIPTDATKFVLQLSIGEVTAELFYDAIDSALQHMQKIMAFSGRRACSVMDYESYKRAKVGK